MPKTQKKNKKDADKTRELRGQILKWYDKHKRKLPWRVVDGDEPEPYKIWLSEIMLQQTTVQAVKPYYIKFLAHWPNIQALANAERDDVLAAWAGLGYYSRARNLHKCAQEITQNRNGKFPQDQFELKKLPGIGDYTSAAIRTIAFNKPATVLDGNIERVMARLFAIQNPLPKSKPELKEKAALFFEYETKRPGDLAQALMDLGATICTPKSPKCMICPLRPTCLAQKQGIAAELPQKSKKKPNPNKKGSVYLIKNKKGDVLLHKRPEKGLFAGMYGLPTSEWSVKPPDSLGNIKKIKDRREKVMHVFTHFNLTLALKTAEITDDFDLTHYEWRPIKDIDISSFPSLFQKALNLFFE